ncbi:MAG: hypothetical protein QXF01_02600 [Candidatus Micrarchaeaceae archaeon]
MLGYLDMYRILRKRFGYLNWWPGDTKDEIIIGAILTQQTSWNNVEKAIENLRKANSLDLRKIRVMELRKLRQLIRPSGFYRQKATRLRNLCSYIFSNYGTLDLFLGMGKEELREKLLGLNGIGKETADSIVLYAAEKPLFVVDAYTRRIMNRVYGLGIDIEYDRLADMLSKQLGNNLKLYKDFHAQLVQLGKTYCKKQPICGSCPLRVHCLYYKTHCSK